MIHSGITCPICKSVFAMPENDPQKPNMTIKKAQAQRLRAKGHSIRVIAKMMRYKSHASVQKLLK